LGFRYFYFGKGYLAQSRFLLCDVFYYPRLVRARAGGKYFPPARGEILGA
jgi:hypothetical protein